MILWYRGLYMDEEVKKNPSKCKKRVLRRRPWSDRPWKKSYYAILLAENPDNLFEIIDTRQLFFRRCGYLDMYVVGLAAHYSEAVDLLQRILEEIWQADNSFAPRKYFDKDDFE